MGSTGAISLFISLLTHFPLRVCACVCVLLVIEWHIVHDGLQSLISGGLIVFLPFLFLSDRPHPAVCVGQNLSVL